MATASSGVALAVGLSRKVKKVLETRTDSPDLLDSLGALSAFYAENTPQARRSLKSTIEHRSLALNHDFLLASLPAQQVLDRVEEEVNALAECCDLWVQTECKKLGDSDNTEVSELLKTACCPLPERRTCFV